MSPRDLLHRLVDNLDESDASLVASLAVTDGNSNDDESFPSGSLPDHRPNGTGIAAGDRHWSTRARMLLRSYANGPGRDRRSLALVALVLLAEPTEDIEDIEDEILQQILLPRGRVAGDANGATGRRQNVADALGSLRAEGLEPTPEARRDAHAYESGELTARDLYAATLARVRSTQSR